MESNIRRAIRSIIESDFVVLEIEESDGENTYIIANSFQESYTDGHQSIEFNVVEGIDITEFMKKSLVTLLSNNKNFISSFMSYIDENPVIRIHFSNNVKWRKWSIVR